MPNKPFENLNLKSSKGMFYINILLIHNCEKDWEILAKQREWRRMTQRFERV